MTQPEDRPQRFTKHWRDEHAAVGDQLLEQAAMLINKEAIWSRTSGALSGPGARDRVLVAGTLAGLATAHYAAANVRATPLPPDPDPAWLEQDLIKMEARKAAGNLGGRIVDF